jgi:hypothetical protein
MSKPLQEGWACLLGFMCEREREREREADDESRRCSWFETVEEIRVSFILLKLWRNW